MKAGAYFSRLGLYIFGVACILFPLRIVNEFVYKVDGYSYQARLDEFTCDSASYGHALMYGTSHVTNARKYAASDKVGLLNIHGAGIDDLDEIIDKSCGPSRRLVLIRMISPIELYERKDHFDINSLPNLTPIERLLKRHAKWLYPAWREEKEILKYSSIGKKKAFILRRFMTDSIFDSEQRFEMHGSMFDFNNVSSDLAESLVKHLKNDRCIILIESPISAVYSKLLKELGIELDIASYLSSYGLERSSYAYIGHTNFDRANSDYYIDADHLNQVGWSIYWKTVKDQVESSVSKCWSN